MVRIRRTNPSMCVMPLVKTTLFMLGTSISFDVRAAGDLHGFYPVPENLDVSLFRSIGNSQAFNYISKTANIVQEAGTPKFALQYYGLDSEDENRTASLTLSLSFNLDSKDLEKLEGFVVENYGGTIQEGIVRIKPYLFYANETGDIVSKQLSEDGLVVPVGGSIALSTDISFLGTRSKILNALNGTSPFGFLIQQKFKMHIIGTVTVPKIELDNLKGIVTHEELVQTVLVEFTDLGIDQPAATAAQYIAALLSALPPKAVTLDDGDAYYGWDSEVIKNTAKSGVPIPEPVGSAAPIDVNTGIVLDLGNVCSKFPDKIVDLETFETGCEGLEP